MSALHVRLATVAAVVALALSGCAAQDQPSPYATATAADLQQTVLHVTESADSGDFAGARARLAELEVETKVGHARGELTAARHDSILAAIALVRADLEALIAEQEAKAAAAAQQAAEEQARKEAEAKAAEEARQAAEAEQRAAQEAAAQEAAAQEAAERAAQQEAEAGDDDDGDDDDDDGKGKGKGKGKGNGKGEDD